MIDAKELVKKFTIDDFKNLVDSYQLMISSETDKEIILYQYDRYRCAEVEQHKPRLYFYTDSKIFKNYITGDAYDLYDFLLKLYKVNDWELNFKGALEIVKHFTTGKATTSRWENHLCKYKKKNYKPQFKIYDEKILKELPQSYPYDWLVSGITKEACEKFEIKEYKRLSQTVLPVRLNGELIGIRVRNRDPFYIEEFGKYRPLQLLNGKMYNFSTNGTFYGWDVYKDKIAETGCVYLVEGEKSVLKSYSWFGYDRPTLAMFGHNLSQWKRKMLRDVGVDTIYYCVDCDFEDAKQRKEWYEGIKTWCQPLVADGFKVYIVADWNLEYVDTKENVFDSSPEVFEEMFKKKKLIRG